MEVTTRSDRSIPMMVLQNVVRPFGTMLIKPGKPLPAGSPQCMPHRSAKRRCDIVERQVDGIWLYDLTPKTGQSTNRRRILYFCGGGFQSPPSSDHWSFVAELTCASRIPVTVVSPPLAPNSPAKDSIPQLVKLYHSLLALAAKSSEQIGLMGDSSGGNIAISITLLALSQDTNALAPSDIFLISPCADARNSNPQMKSVDRNDPILSVKYTGWVAEQWTKGMDAADPSVSPLLADLSVLQKRNVRLHGIVGTWDVLAPDTVLLLEKAQKQGVSGRWLVWERQMHCFPLAWRYGLSDSKQGKAWIVQTVQGLT